MPTQPALLIIHTGQPPEPVLRAYGNQPAWFAQALAGITSQISVVRPFQDEALPDPKTVDLALITGSWSMVSHREAWSERTAGWLRTAIDVDTPLLGICYGHQLIAHALGGEVDDHPDGTEMGVQEIELLPAAADEPLLNNLPPRFDALLAHRQTVLSLPPGALALARSPHDPHQIVRYGPQALSFQFHPEMWPELMAGCVACSQALNDKAKQQVLDGLRPTPTARQLLRNTVASACATNATSAIYPQATFTPLAEDMF